MTHIWVVRRQTVNTEYSRIKGKVLKRSQITGCGRLFEIQT